MWFDFIDPYLKAGMIYRCPALDWLDATFVSGLNNRIYGYGVNWPHLFSSSGSAKLDQVPRPSETLLLCDAYTNYDSNGVLHSSELGFPVVYCREEAHGWESTQKPRMADGNTSGRHNGDTNVLYCDMHVHTWPKSYVDQPYSSAATSGNNDLFGHFDLP